MTHPPLLSVQNLRVSLETAQGQIEALRGLSFDMQRGEKIGLIGESGCGKSLTALAIMGLLPMSSNATGSVTLNGKQLIGLRDEEMCRIRGARMGMIFQEPMTALNPLQTIWQQIAEPLQLHQGMSHSATQLRALELLERVQLSRAKERLMAYPHQLSGGQRQRIGIARALALKPKFIVCDEPVSALDVSIQAQVINLLDDLRDDFGLSYLFIAHDLSVVQHISNRVAVMYLGKIMELAPTEDLYKSPHHPYTKALLSAIPLPDPLLERKREQIILSGDIPNPVNPPTGCVFNTRCWKAQDKCRTTEPALVQIGASQVACHFPD